MVDITSISDILNTDLEHLGISCMVFLVDHEILSPECSCKKWPELELQRSVWCQ